MEKEAAKEALIYGTGSPVMAWGDTKASDDKDGDSVVSQGLNSLSVLSQDLASDSLVSLGDEMGAVAGAGAADDAGISITRGVLIHLDEEKSLSMAESVPAPEKEEEEGEDTQEPAMYKKAGRKPLKMLIQRPVCFPWRGHGMVAKLLDPPLRCKSTRSLLDIEVLGPRGYWLEQCKVALADRLGREDRARTEAARLVATDQQARAEYERNKMQRGLKEYDPADPVPVRTDEFLGLVKKDRDRKYIVRDDISVPDEEEGSDSDKSM